MSDSSCHGEAGRPGGAHEGYAGQYKTDIARLAEDNAKRDAEAAKREARLILTVAGLLAFAVAVLGLLIRWPG